MANIYETSSGVYSVKGTPNETVSTNNLYNLTMEELFMLNEKYKNSGKSALMYEAGEITNRKLGIAKLFDEQSDKVNLGSNEIKIEQAVKVIGEVVSKMTVPAIKLISSFFRKTADKLEENQAVKATQEISEDEALANIVGAEKAEEFKQKNKVEEAEIDSEITEDIFQMMDRLTVPEATVETKPEVENEVVKEALEDDKKEVKQPYQKVTKTTFTMDEVFGEDQPKPTVEEVEKVAEVLEMITEIIERLSTPKATTEATTKVENEASKEAKKEEEIVITEEEKKIINVEVKAALEELQNHNGALASTLGKNLDGATPEKAEIIRKQAILATRKYKLLNGNKASIGSVKDYLPS